MDGKNNKTSPTYQKGQQIKQYRIIGVLDRGNFTDKYLVKYTQGGSAYMMIEMFLQPLVNELKESFLSQAQDLRRLEHPHILRLLEAGVEDHYPLLVTDYTSLVTLRKECPQGDKQPFSRILPYLRQIASALQYTHEHQLLHKDIRPENILIAGENTVLLRGFSIEAIRQNRERLNVQKAAILSKVIAYNAPELIQGKASPASDQYALAIMIYELLSGELPFTGSYLEIANQHLYTLPSPLSQKTPDLSPRMGGLIMKALEKRPERRFSSVQEFISELEKEYNTQYRHNDVRQTLPPVVPQQALPPSANAASAPVTSMYTPNPTLASPIPSQLSYSGPSYSDPTPVIAQQRLDNMAYQPTTLPMPDGPLAPRRNSNTFTRRAFAAGLVGVAMLGGAGGWYVLSKKLAPPAPTTITGGDNTHPPATPIVVNNQNALIFTGHLAAVNAVIWSPDGKLIASASNDKFVQIFDSVSGVRKIIYNGHAEEVAAVAWSPNGNFIASGGQDKTVQVWNAVSGKKIFTYTRHADRVNSVAWSLDNQEVASGSEDKAVQVWNAANGRLAFNFLGHTAGVLCVGWQANNSSLASGSWDGTLRDWAIVQHGNHFNAGDQIFSYGGHGKNEVNALAWSPDGNFIASAGADQTVQISNGVNGTLRPPAFTGHQSKIHSNPVRAVDWSPNGNFIASGDSNGIVLVWNVSQRKTVFTYHGHKGAINAVSWSPDGKRIASASVDSTVHVWQPD